jgi:hypothetical protein
MTAGSRNIRERLRRTWQRWQPALRRFFWPGELTVTGFEQQGRSYMISVAVGILLLTAYFWFHSGWVALLVPFIGTLMAAVIRSLIVSPAWLGMSHVKVYISIFCAAGIWFVSHEKIPSTEFYKACASLIPVLLLAFVLERRQEYVQSQLFGQRVDIIFNVIALVIGGVETLQVLAYDDASVGDARVVSAMIAFSVTSLTLSLVGRPAPAAEAEED